MSTVQTRPLPTIWKERLDLVWRSAPELYEDSAAAGRSPHAGAIRMALAELGASAVFCVQDVPTVVIVVLNEYDRDYVINLHGVLWNQGLATLLLVLSGDILRAFSLARIPRSDGSTFSGRCLVRELNATTDALAAKDLIYGAESGRLWEMHDRFFKVKERVDHVLLKNLTVSFTALCKDGLPKDAAQALLIQTMFIAYLEDREIVGPEYFKDASHGVTETFLGILQSSSSKAMYRLFRRLRNDFNGDLFVAPCSFDSQEPQPRVDLAHMKTLERFLSGREEMTNGGGQLRFWGYDFKYIPIELISAVYDRFLSEQEEERRKRGAYYTPMFLADTVIATLWDTMPERARTSGQFLDPACGSGIFLVRAFQLLCEHWRDTHNLRQIPWSKLLLILSRLRGWDLSPGAVRVAVFSLYLALLQEVRPPDIRSLVDRGRLLPRLWNHTLRAEDFFEVPSSASQADVIFGNPPWCSRRGAKRSSLRWSEKNQLQMPGGEDAWAFVWKALRHVRENGVVAFLLPAMGFLHNHAARAVKARQRLLRETRIFRIINFSDMRFQLFERAARPAALVILGQGKTNKPGYRLDYWTPKADLNLKIRRAITLSSVDKQTIASHEAIEDPSVFKRRLWISGPESKLFSYLASLPRLGDSVGEYRSLARSHDSLENRWIIGHGFKPASLHRIHEAGYQVQYSDKVATMPYLPASSFLALAQEYELFQPFEHGHVHRRGFERAFNGPRILVPRGVSIRKRRLQASYLEEPLTFQHIILGISVPAQDIKRAKLLTALLNSKLLFWYAFHCTASLGSDRPEVQQAELLRLPFPTPYDIQQSSRAEAAGEELVSLIDDARNSVTGGFTLQSDTHGLLRELDSLCYKYFGLGDDEIALVEDTVEKIIPSAQPHMGTSVDLWNAANEHDRRTYASTLANSLKQWFSDDVDIAVALEARNEDLALLHLRLVEAGWVEPYREHDDQDIGEAFGRLRAQVETRLPGNFQLIPDFRLFIGNSLYLVKPLQRRFWLESAAIADADAVAMDLHDAVALGDSD